MDTNRRNQDAKETTRETTVRRAAENDDLPDSPHDAARLKSDEAILDLPDVSDIPGQEHVQAPHIGEMGDTTISSADEEGDGLFDDLNAGNDSND